MNPKADSRSVFSRRKSPPLGRRALPTERESVLRWWLASGVIQPTFARERSHFPYFSVVLLLMVASALAAALVRW